MRIEKQNKRREEIEQAALDLLIEKGFHSATLLRIATRAQCSNETMYRWYGSKSALLAVLVEKNRAALETELWTSYQDNDELEALEAMGEVILRRVLTSETIALIRAAQAEQDANRPEWGDANHMEALFSEATRTCLEGQARAALFRGGSSLGKEDAEVIDTFLSLLLGDLLLRSTLGRKIELTKKQRVARSRDAMEKTRRIFSVLGPDARKVLTVLDDRWIDYPAADQVIESLGELLTLSGEACRPTAMLYGLKGQGKTSLLEKYWERHGQSYIDDDKNCIKQVIVADAPPVGYASVKNLYLCILRNFWVPHHSSWPDEELRKVLERMLIYCRVSVLVIDDTHNLMCDDIETSLKIMHEIKRLKDAHRLAVVLAGDESIRIAAALTVDSPKDILELHLQPWTANGDFRAFLDQLEETFDLPEVSNISSDGCVDALLSGTEGATGKIVRCVKNSARRVLESSRRSSIDVDLLYSYSNAERYPKPGSVPTEPWSPQLEEQCRDAGYDSAMQYIETSDERYTTCPYKQGSLAARAWKESFDIQVMTKEEEGSFEVLGTPRKVTFVDDL